MSVKGNYIEGDLAVGRNISANGNAEVKGSATVMHNLTVGGWLEANNIKGAGKGCFMTDAALRAAYPNPMPGDWAMVGTDLKVWTESNGRWVETEAAPTVVADTMPANAEFDALKGRMSAAEGRLSTHWDMLEQLGPYEEEQQATIEGHGERLDSIEETIGDHERALGEHDTRIDNVQTVLGQRILAAENRLSTHWDAIEGAAAWVQEQEPRIDNLEENVSDHASALTAHDTRISNVQAAVESLSADAEGHMQMLGEQSARITSIEEGIEKIVGTIELGHLDLDDVDRHEMMVAFASNRMPALYVVKAMSLSGGVLTMFCSGSPERLEQVLVTRWKLMPDGKFHTSQQNAGARVYQRSIEGFGGVSEGEWTAWTEIAGEGVAASIAEARAIAEEAIPQSALTSDFGYDENKVASQKLVGVQCAGLASTINSTSEAIVRHFVKKLDIATELAPEEEGQSDDKVASQSLVASVKDALDSQCASLGESLAAKADKEGVERIDGLIAQLEARIAMLEQHLNDQ